MSEVVEVLGSAPNAWVVQVPGRAFPGVVIQGDSLKTLYELSREIQRQIGAADTDEANALAGELGDILSSYLTVYEKTLLDHKRSLPYQH